MSEWLEIYTRPSFLGWFGLIATTLLLMVVTNIGFKIFRMSASLQADILMVLPWIVLLVIYTIWPFEEYTTIASGPLTELLLFVKYAIIFLAFLIHTYARRIFQVTFCGMLLGIGWYLYKGHRPNREKVKAFCALLLIPIYFIRNEVRTFVTKCHIPPELEEKRQTCLKYMGLRSARILLTETEGPCTIGLIRPMVLLPRDFCEWSEAEQRVTLLHEFLHIKDRHLLRMLIGAIPWIFMLYNLPILIWSWQLRNRLELAVDDNMSRFCAADTYEQVLRSVLTRLARSHQKRVVGVECCFGVSLSERIAYMKDMSANSTKGGKYN